MPKKVFNFTAYKGGITFFLLLYTEGKKNKQMTARETEPYQYTIGYSEPIISNTHLCFLALFSRTNAKHCEYEALIK